MNFNFRMRMSQREWDILSYVMLRENQYYRGKAQRDWFFNQVNRFCREVALPYIESCEHHQSGSELVEKSILIQEINFAHSTNIKILGTFAALKQKTITQIIQRYIVDGKIIREEQVRAALRLLPM